MKLHYRSYLRYKFFNSLFTGAVGGSVFTLYSSLAPSTFSIGGIVLALGLMGMAYLYHRLMILERFFFFSLAAESVMFFMVLYFLLYPHHSLTALIIYGAYQLSYVFGGYLVRAETHFAQKSKMMGWMDIAKQQGYLAGLGLSYLFYRLLEHYTITEARAQVYALNLLLLPLEIVIIFFLLRGFRS